MDQRLNIKPETVKLLEENTGGKLFDIGLGDDFFDSDTKSKGNKSKNKQVELKTSAQQRKLSTE